MRRHAAACSALLLAASLPAAAQEMPPELRDAQSLGWASHALSVASPCFPREGGDADLHRMLSEARARLHGQPAQEQAFQRGESLAAMQQRHIPRSDPVACRQIRSILHHMSRG